MSFRRVKTRGAPEWLYQRHLKNSCAYWIRYRKSGVRLEEELKATTPRDAHDEGQVLLSTALRSNTEGKPLAVIRCEHLCDEIVALKKGGKSGATHELNEIMSRVHVKPYLNEYSPYITDLNASVWEQYKVHKRLENPTVALFNHWKFFLNLGKLSRQKGLIKERIVFEFDKEKEDFREEGQLISEEHFALIIKHANKTWRDRSYFQRYTGMRPGEVRRLKKDRVQLFSDHAIISLQKKDTKNRKARSFVVRSLIVLEILRRRMASESEFFFPARGIPQQAMDRCLSGWEGAIKRANIELVEAGKPPMPIDLTPHDLRHTYLTNEFKKPGANTALICYQAGLTMEEAEKTYLHFKAEDTSAMAEDLAREAGLLRA